MLRTWHKLVLAACFAVVCACEPRPAPLSAQPATTPARESFIIRCDRQCDAVTAQVERAGGHVRIRYRNIDAISADIDSGTLKLLSATLGENAVTKDLLVAPPQPVEKFDVSLHNVEGMRVRSLR